MAEAPHIEDDERDLVAVRGFAFLLRHRRAIIGLSVLFGALGFAFGQITPRPYESRAAILLGVRFPAEPLEMPLIAGERLSGILEKNKSKYGADVGFRVSNRRDPKTRSLTRVIDVSVSAATSSAAKSILDASIAELIEAHKMLHAYETGLLERERSYYQRAEKRIAGALESIAGGIEEPAIVVPGEKKPQLLSGALLEIQRMQNAMNAMLSSRRLPQTLISEPPTTPELGPSKVSLFSIAGVVFGFMCGLTWGLLRSIPAPRPFLRSIRSVEEHDAHRAP